MADRPLEDSYDTLQKTGRIVAKTGLVNLTGGASELSGTRVFVESENDKRHHAKINRRDWLGMSLKEQAEVEKWCPDCKEYYPATTEYWHANYKGQYGLYYICIDCRRIIDQRRYDNRMRKRLVIHKSSSET
jgi:hypothetical protein